MSALEGAAVVADVCRGGKDAHGDLIQEVYQRKGREYAVYRTPHRVRVHFADESDQAQKQRSALAPLLPLRDEIDGLSQGWRDHSDGAPKSSGFLGLRNPERLRAKVECQDRRLAGALVQALEDDAPGARLWLEKIKSDMLNERVAYARFEYLLTAFATALILMFTAWLLASLLPTQDPALVSLFPMSRTAAVGVIALLLTITVGLVLGTASEPWSPRRTALIAASFAIPLFAILIWPQAPAEAVAASHSVGLGMWRGFAAGAVGAFFSIALAIKSRTVLPDLLRTANMMDAILRIAIGAIGGAVLIGLVSADVVRFNLLAPGHTLFAVVAGFFAGFAERLVPDLLERASERPATFDAQMAASRAQREAHNDKRLGQVAPGEAAVADEPKVTHAAANTNVEEAEDEVGPEGFNLEDDELTRDDELPVAMGGVARQHT